MLGLFLTEGLSIVGVVMMAIVTCVTCATAEQVGLFVGKFGSVIKDDFFAATTPASNAATEGNF